MDDNFERSLYLLSISLGIISSVLAIRVIFLQREYYKLSLELRKEQKKIINGKTENNA